MIKKKKNEMKKSLKKYQEELEKLSQLNPSGNYVQLEKIIKQLNQLIDSLEKKENKFKIFFKLVTYLLLLYLVYLFITTAVLGFASSYLVLADYFHLFYILPIIAFILFAYNKFINIVLNVKKTNYPLLELSLYSAILFLIIALIDSVYLHVFANFWQTFVVLIFASVFCNFGEYYTLKYFLRRF